MPRKDENYQWWNPIIGLSLNLSIGLSLLFIGDCGYYNSLKEKWPYLKYSHF